MKILIQSHPYLIRSALIQGGRDIPPFQVVELIIPPEVKDREILLSLPYFYPSDEEDIFIDGPGLVAQGVTPAALTSGLRMLSYRGVFFPVYLDSDLSVEDSSVLLREFDRWRESEAKRYELHELSRT